MRRMRKGSLLSLRNLATALVAVACVGGSASAAASLCKESAAPGCGGLARSKSEDGDGACKAGNGRCPSAYILPDANEKGVP